MRRGHGVLACRLTQVLPGHEVFGSYLARIGGVLVLWCHRGRRRTHDRELSRVGQTQAAAGQGHQTQLVDPRSGERAASRASEMVRDFAIYGSGPADKRGLRSRTRIDVFSGQEKEKEKAKTKTAAKTIVRRSPVQISSI